MSENVENLEKGNEEQYVPADTIENRGNLIAEINFKPKSAPIICIIAGVVFIITLHPLAVGLGIFIIAMTIFVGVKVKDYRTMGIYDRCLILYSTEDPSLARRIEYDDIEEWTCKSGKNSTDALYIKMKSGEIVYKNTFQISAVYRSLNKVIAKKESREVQAERNRNTKLKFSFPFRRKKK